MRHLARLTALVLFIPFNLACTKANDADSSSDSERTAPPASRSRQAADLPGAPTDPHSDVPPTAEAGRAPAPQIAKIGQVAPDFTLKDLEGKETRLSDHRGKIVVLEWFNPQCPFVKASHTKGSLKGTADALSTKGVVYFAINSGAPGKQGHGKEVNLKGKADFGLSHPILLDETGSVGRTYGATNTPHLFVINAAGALAYQGAIDNSKDGEGASPEGGTLVNYLTQAVAELLAGKPVSVSETKAYGCSVKYDL